MKIIFTKNNLPFSKFLRWGLNEPVSHMAIVFDERIVFHSNFFGIHIEWYDTFKQHNDIVYEINIDPGLTDEEKVYQGVITKYDGNSYDFGALMYLILNGFLYKFFKKPMPLHNKWAANNKYLCIELLSVFEDIKLDIDLAAATPFEVYKLLKVKYG